MFERCICRLTCAPASNKDISGRVVQGTWLVKNERFSSKEQKNKIGKFPRFFFCILHFCKEKKTKKKKQQKKKKYLDKYRNKDGIERSVTVKRSKKGANSPPASGGREALPRTLNREEPSVLLRS